MSDPPLHAGGRAVRTALAASFVLWAATFILRSSIRGIDGLRYFCLFDDAMISMRYAANLAAGAGLAWNPGERVEGYTNFLWTLLMSLAARAFDSSNAVLAIQVAGVGVLLGAAWACRRLAAEVSPDDGVAPTVALGFALFHYPVAFWTLLGMETGVVLLLSALAMASVFACEGRPRACPVLVVLLALLYLTRPDTLIVALLVLAYRGLTARWRRAAVHEALGLASVVIVHAAFRFGYYGALLPNTYSLKVEGVPVAFRVANGLAYVRPWLLTAAPLIVLAAGALWQRDRRRKLLLLATPAALLAYQVWIGGDINDHWRFLCGAIVLLGTLAVPGARAWVDRLAPRAAARNAWVAVAVTVALALPGLSFFREQAFLDEAKSVPENRASVNVALMLRLVLEPDATIAVFWAGAIPYYARFRAIDLLGKSDARTAALPPDLSGAVSWSRMRSVPGHNKYDLSHAVLELRPTFLEHDVWGRQDLSQYVREHYVQVLTPYGRLLLLRGSRSVRWNALGRLATEPS